MKKVIALLLFLLVATTSVKSQFFVRIGIGGGLGLPVYGTTWDHYANNQTNYFSNSVLNSSLGTGINGSVSVSYFFSKYIGVDLTINEFFGFKCQKSLYNEIDSFSTFYMKTTRSGRMFQLNPCIILTPGFAKINPYVKVGLISGLIPIIKEVKTYEGRDYYDEYDGKYYGGIALGFTGSCGVDFNLTKLISAFIEFEGNYINYSPKKYTLTKHILNGQEVDLSSQPTMFKETIFVKTVTSDDNKDYDQPLKELKTTSFFSSMNFNFGIKFTL